MSDFPFLDGNIVAGKLVSIFREGKMIGVNKEFRAHIEDDPSMGVRVARILDPNPLKTIGSPLPSEALIIAYRYEEWKGLTVQFPIAEGVILRGYSSPQFDEDIRRLLKEEESSIVFEGTVFHQKLQGLDSTMREALSLFQQESYSHAKTSCRKIIEKVRHVSGEWRTIDKSDSLADKFKDVVNSVYSFSSIGGPHLGVSTREETEFILKSTLACLLYVNSLLKNERISESGKNDKADVDSQINAT